MARTQALSGLAEKELTLAGTNYQLYATSLFVKSFTVQARSDNTGDVTLRDANGNPLCQLAPGFSACIYGDNMDNGTTAKIDVASVLASSSAAGDYVILSGLEGL